MTVWTSADIPDQRGRRFVVTGANGGLGEVCARALVGAGAEVVLASRNTDKAQRVADDLGDRAEVRRLDLADLSSVREFAESVDSVDVLVNNAGIMAVPEGRTADGFERQVGTNHLGSFALTGLLIDRVRERVVTMSSFLHRIGRISLDDLNWERRRYDRWRAYGQSKLANLLFTYELQRRLGSAGSPVRALAAHPGYAATGLQSHTETYQDQVMGMGNVLFAQSAEMGALPGLYAATVPEATPGGFVGPSGVFNMRGFPSYQHSNARSRDEETARRLWDLSERLTGVTYPGL